MPARIDIRFDGSWKILEPSGLSWEVRDVSPGLLAQWARFAARSASGKLALSRIGPAAAWEGDMFWRPLNELLFWRPPKEEG